MNEELYESPNRTDKIVAQLKKHPLVPGGMLATCGALGMAFRRLHQRDSAGYQRWLRARVLAQGLTVVAIVAAGMQEFGSRSAVESSPSLPPMSPSERLAFEKRMKEAEEAHYAETRILDQERSPPPLRMVTTQIDSPESSVKRISSTKGPNNASESNTSQPSSSSSFSRFSWFKFWR